MKFKTKKKSQVELNVSSGSHCVEPDDALVPSPLAHREAEKVISLPASTQDQMLNRIMRLCVLWMVPITVSYLVLSICCHWHETYTLARSYNLHSIREMIAFELTRFWLWPTYSWTDVSLGALPALSIATLFSQLKLNSKTKHAVGLALTMLIVLLCVVFWIDSRTNLLHISVEVALEASFWTAVYSVSAAFLSWAVYFWLSLRVRH